MYNVSSAFLTRIKEPSRNIASKVVIGNTTLDTSIVVDFSIEGSIGNNNMPTIGGAVSSKLTLNILNDITVPVALVGVPIRPFIAIEIDNFGTLEWIQLGVFHAEYSDIVKTKQTTSIDAFDVMVQYDAMSYVSNLVFPSTSEAIISELTSLYGVTFASQSRPSIAFELAPTGTVRQVIGLLASCMTTNATANYLGQVEFRGLQTVGFEFDANNYVDFKLTSDAIVKISQLSIPTEEDVDPIIVGDSSGFGLSFVNSNIISNAQLQVVFNRMFPLSYYAYYLKAQGMPHLQLGDMLSFTDSSNIKRQIIILYHKFTFNGGMTSEFKIDAPTETVTQVPLTGGSVLDGAIKQSYDNLILAVNSATKLITGNNGGVVITILDNNGKPTELVIADTGNINTAQKIWRWNASGLGFSSNGYNGTYALAITSDGHIVADFITTGTLNANLIKTGILKSANGKTQIDMTNGTFNFGGGKLVYDGTSLAFGVDAIKWDDVGEKPTIPTQYTDQNALDKIKATYMDADGIWTPSVYANNIDVTNGKIASAQIEDLVVGGNVSMGATARIDWRNVDSQPSIPTQYTDADAIAKIDATYFDINGVWTPSVYANNIKAGEIVGSTLKTSNTSTNINLENQWLDYNYNGTNKMSMGFMTGFDGYSAIPLVAFGTIPLDRSLKSMNESVYTSASIYYDNDLTLRNGDNSASCSINLGNDGSIKFTGTVDFTDTPVTGLLSENVIVIAKFG